ncbi:hypothetical protein IWQ60_009135 [Tieghemiomyces parasiticus]|uniref:Uncharacterized protein n=1 Tax=Tieghemiomyces parasiticus TaxID=78921 RepID=A0A9W7ZP67_9FUNG|nr:hypothetical protein IWQ60_009135 [Tieghemiomyces parasiticus]
MIPYAAQLIPPAVPVDRFTALLPMLSSPITSYFYRTFVVNLAETLGLSPLANIYTQACSLEKSVGYRNYRGWAAYPPAREVAEPGYLQVVNEKDPNSFGCLFQSGEGDPDLARSQYLHHLAPRLRQINQGARRHRVSTTNPRLRSNGHMLATALITDNEAFLADLVSYLGTHEFMISLRAGLAHIIPAFDLTLPDTFFDLKHANQRNWAQPGQASVGDGDQVNSEHRGPAFQAMVNDMAQNVRTWIVTALAALGNLSGLKQIREKMNRPGQRRVHRRVSTMESTIVAAAAIANQVNVLDQFVPGLDNQAKANILELLALQNFETAHARLLNYYYNHGHTVAEQSNANDMNSRPAPSLSILDNRHVFYFHGPTAELSFVTYDVEDAVLSST